MVSAECDNVSLFTADGGPLYSWNFICLVFGWPFPLDFFLLFECSFPGAELCSGGIVRAWGRVRFTNRV